jgi:gamma-glutamyl-gamma-aminobutyrate hydrolase PuuD
MKAMVKKSLRYMSDQPKYILIAPPKGQEELGTYIKWVESNGFSAVILEEGAQNISGPLLLCGGADLGVNPTRDQRELEWIQMALDADQPIIGVCRGMQVLNHFFGGKVSSIVDSIVEDHRSDDFTEDVDHSERISQYHWVMDLNNNMQQVNSRHHQYCETVAKNFTVTHLSFGCGYIPEAFEDLQHKIWAVQWHPERMESADNSYPLDKLKVA